MTTSNPKLLSTSSSSNSSSSNNDAQDKLRNGPCSKIYNQLEQCAASKGVDLNNHKLKLKACPSDTDRLIKCMNKHPMYFLG